MSCSSKLVAISSILLGIVLLERQTSENLGDDWGLGAYFVGYQHHALLDEFSVRESFAVGSYFLRDQIASFCGRLVLIDSPLEHSLLL